MKTVLFICTGNYYRSRIAEILFNHYAERESISANAFSRGFRLNPDKNKGVISPHAVSYLSLLDIPAGNTSPSRLDVDDLNRAWQIIVLDEKEHRPMMQQAFPEWEHKVVYWQFEDDYIADPGDVLPLLNKKVKSFVRSLQASSVSRI
jgi:protein-tyrosine phosphatase